MTTIIHEGAPLQRFRISDCPMCREWPINLAGGCACCEGKSTAMATPDAIVAALGQALVQQCEIAVTVEAHRIAGMREAAGIASDANIWIARCDFTALDMMQAVGNAKDAIAATIESAARALEKADR